MYLNTIKFSQGMSSKGNNSLHRCIFCNSLSHVAAKCNSNMKGRRQILTDMGRNFMLDDALPNFKSLPINELRFIASKYEVFQETSNRRDMRRCASMSGYFSRECEVEYLYSPIPTTLTKSRMISDLVRRWIIYKNVRTNHNHEKPEDEDCPICMDCMSTPKWNVLTLKWENVYNKEDTNDEPWPNGIKTVCGHEFCGSCWERHLSANTKRDYMSHQQYVCCPLCRHKIEY